MIKNIISVLLLFSVLIVFFSEKAVAFEPFLEASAQANRFVKFAKYFWKSDSMLFAEKYSVALKEQNCPEMLNILEEWKQNTKYNFIPYCFLGDYYETGSCVDKNPKKAFEIYHEAAVKGGTKASIVIADYYKKGFGVKKDLKKSDEWLDMAVYRRGSLCREKQLYIFEGFSDSFPTQLDEKIKRVDLIKSSGSWAQYLTGINLLEGKNGFSKDPISACYWLRMADKNGEPLGLYKLSKMLDRLIFPKRFASLIYLAEAATDGLSKAQKEVGLLTLEGKGYEQNYKRAYGWLLLAKKNGEDTEKYLKQIEKEHKEDAEMAIFSLRYYKPFYTIQKNIEITTYFCVDFHQFNYVPSGK
ncbi:MAG: sel1 repeat family protein [Alphaproteobacteria bacterium]|nr:sel1 repeat family protein [Alphaproteobacteria bacterium]